MNPRQWGKVTELSLMEIPVRIHQKQETLSDETGLSVHTIEHAVKELSDASLIQCEERRSKSLKGKGKRLSNAYYLLIDDWQEYDRLKLIGKENDYTHKRLTRLRYYDYAKACWVRKGKMFDGINTFTIPRVCITAMREMNKDERMLYIHLMYLLWNGQTPQIAGISEWEACRKVLSGTDGVLDTLRKRTRQGTKRFATTLCSLRVKGLIGINAKGIIMNDPMTLAPFSLVAEDNIINYKAQHNPAYSELLGLFQQDPKGFLERRGILVCDENRKGTEITFHCPLHDDSTASGHINKETGVWHCKAGCGAGNLITLKGRPETAEDAVHQLTELAKDEGIECAFEPASFYQTMIDKGCTYYDYHDEHGQVIYRKFRVEPKGKRKVFYPFMYDASSERFYTLDGKKFPELLYRYPKPETQIILLTEGEKDADNLAAVYKDEYPVILATTSGNADSWKDDFADCFHKGIRRVYIFPDNDKSGREYANKVSRSLAGRGIPYTIVDLQSEKDVSDYRDKYAGHHCWDAEHPLTLATEDPAVFLKIDGMPFRNWQEQQEALEAMI